jgi:hypothetical protein
MKLITGRAAWQHQCPKRCADVFIIFCEVAVKDCPDLLRAVAAQIMDARLSTGARVLDASDFREWLIELAEKAEQTKTLEEFLSQT